MNVTFVLNDPEKYEKPFADLCAQANISSVKDTYALRSTTHEKIQVLIDTMQKLETL